MKHLVKISAISLLLLVVSNGWADGLSLLCSGIATEESEIEKNTKTCESDSHLDPAIFDTLCIRGKSVSSKSTIKTKDEFPITVDFFLAKDGKSGWIDLPTSISPKKFPRSSSISGTNKYSFVEAKSNDRKITARFVINRFNKPLVKIDRLTGKMNFRYTDVSFNGNCEILDQTKRKF
jgi:hypothetical protein|tara:strand:- start:16 stop:549 length:534 start_codon:yes stop_codon:yes gene_type:complete